MDYKLERKVGINYETKHKSLYEWCLSEYDDSGKQIGSDQIPWPWNFYFIGSSFKVVNYVSIENESDDDGRETSTVKHHTRIVGILHSGCCRDGENLTDDVNFSMFGTGRTVKDFQICIYQAKDNETESCSLTAIPSYETEIDFRDEVQDDFVGFDVTLHKEKFTEFVRLLEQRSVDSVLLRVGKVAGIFSEWSPSISTYKAKILSRMHKIDGMIDGKFKPQSVGDVGEFELNFVTLNKLYVKQSFPPFNVEKAFENPVIDEWVEEPSLQSASDSQEHERFASSMALAVKLIGSLKTPLWCIFAVLVLLLMK
jgi:hypothetical protein